MAAGRVGPGLPVLSEYGSDLRSFIEFIRQVLSAKIPDGLSRTRRVGQSEPDLTCGYLMSSTGPRFQAVVRFQASALRMLKELNAGPVVTVRRDCIRTETVWRDVH